MEKVAMNIEFGDFVRDPSGRILVVESKAEDGSFFCYNDNGEEFNWLAKDLEITEKFNGGGIYGGKRGD